jgi:hypothetical protein
VFSCGKDRHLFRRPLRSTTRKVWVLKSGSYIDNEHLTEEEEVEDLRQRWKPEGKPKRLGAASHAADHAEKRAYRRAARAALMAGGHE